MKTRITELCGIKYPIILAGMTYITGPEMVAAVSNAGGLGILAIGQFSPKETRAAIRKIRSLTDKPFGINSALIFPMAKKNVDVAIEEKVPVINYALGRPWFIDTVHEYGGKSVVTVSTVRHALRGEQLGADALIVTGHEAAAHGGNVTSLVLIPQVVSQAKVPAIAAGGFSDGKGLAAALLLGAEAISMGTRFMLTKESPLNEYFKQAILKSSEEDTLYSTQFDGLPCRVLKTKTAETVARRKAPLIELVTSTLKTRRILELSWGESLRSASKMRKGGMSLWKLAFMSSGILRFREAILEGDERFGLMLAGQSCGSMTDLPSCQELIERTVVEAEQALEKTRGKFSS